MFTKKEEKTIIKFLNIMEEKNFSKITEVEVVSLYEKIKVSQTGDGLGTRFLGYDIFDSDGNRYSMNSVIPLRTITSAKLGLRRIKMVVGVLKND